MHWNPQERGRKVEIDTFQHSFYVNVFSQFSCRTIVTQFLTKSTATSYSFMMTDCILNYQIITKHLMDHKYYWFLIFRFYFILFMWVTQEEIWLASYHLSITLRESERVNVATRVISAVVDAFSKCTFKFSFQFSIELQKILSNIIYSYFWTNFIR